MTITIASPPPSPPAASFQPRQATTQANNLCCPNCGFILPSPASNPGSPATVTAAADLPQQQQQQQQQHPTAAELELAKAQQHIADLESQIKQLNEKATAAIYRWADYENELSQLRGSLQSPPP
ncbi:hypothetical protein jhhlp_002549 [Lomentospora prolificans]|uniref:Uncharacterized protein n=1 Tax=Lomentospora prolificans TaxID=41688 RepID=A0A2N3NEK4_9PEZI|nr:hypothetical protein jhhlp_002549 [Lomentospora prolificans]